jgi:DNA transformation protein
MRLSQLVNIGAKTEQLLNEVGIFTRQELQTVGAIEAWIRMRCMHPETTTLSILYVLQGALLGLTPREIPVEIVEQLHAGLETYVLPCP